MNPMLLQDTVKRIVGYIVNLLMIIVALHSTGVIQYDQQRILDTSYANPDGGFGYILALGINNVSALYGKTPLTLYENGIALGPPNSVHEDIRNSGRGRYSHWNDALFFSASDNSDPRTNSYKYSIRYSPPIPGFILLGLIITWLVTHGERIEIMKKKLLHLTPATITIIIMLITVAYRGWVWIQHPNLTFDGHMILGMPVSDARAWDTLATEFASGTKSDSSWELWDGRRPLYYWLMGAVYMITGPSVFVTQLLKFILSIASSALIFDSLRRILPLHIAIVSVLVHIFLQFDAFESLVTRTEGFGYFFTHLALWFFILAAERAKQDRDFSEGGQERFFKRALFLFFLGGVSIGLANLIRPLNLASIAVVPTLILYTLLPYFGLSRKSIKKGSLILLIPIIGCAITLAPWLIRQKIKYDILSISDNSVEMTLAASLPDFGTWNSKVSQMHPNATLIAERYKFYEQRLAESLEVNLSFYISNSWMHFKGIIKSLTVSTGILLLGLTLSLLAVWKDERKHLLNNLILLGVTAVVAYLLIKFSHKSYLIWLFGSFLALSLRNPASILAGLVIPGAITLGFCAFQGERVIYGFIWQVVSLALFAQWSCLYAISNLRIRPIVGWQTIDAHSGWNPKLSRASKLLFFTLAVVLLALIVLGAIRHEMIPIDRSIQHIDEGTSQSWVNRALSESCGDLSALKPFLSVRRGYVRKDYLIKLKQNEQVNHWNTLFNQPTFPRKIFEIMPRTPENYLVMPDNDEDLLTRNEYVFVGVRRLHEGNMSFEVMRTYHAKSHLSALPCPSTSIVEAHSKHLLASLSQGLLLKTN